MIVEANPLEVGALETLREIYVKLGDDDKHADVVRIAGHGRARPSASVAPASGCPAPAAARRAAPTSWTRSPFRLHEVAATAAGTGPRPAVERRQAACPASAIVSSPRGSSARSSSTRPSPPEGQRATSSGPSSSRCGLLTRTARRVPVEAVRDPAITVAQRGIGSGRAQPRPRPDRAKYEVLAIKREGNSITLAMADPTNVFALDDVGFMTGMTVVPVVAAQSVIRKAIERLYETQASGIAEIISEMASVTLGDVEVVEGEDEQWAKADIFELKESADEAPVVRLVNMILVDAIRRGASDIHLEPYEKVFRVRFRIDGVLHEIMTPPKRLEAALTSRVKIMSTLDIAERRLPQDGRIKLRYSQREIDFRVSTLPTIFGEKTVMRILDKDALQLDLTMLGFDPWSLEQFNHAIHQPYGMILITGPTGSGKTTTLYSAINTINNPDVNIMTAEDPVEYNLKGVNQVQVNEGIGRTFAAALRSLPQTGPGHHPRRRDAGPRDRADRHPRRAHRPPGPDHAAHQRLPLDRRAAARHGHPALPGLVRPELDPRPAAGPEDLQGLQAAL